MGNLAKGNERVREFIKLQSRTINFPSKKEKLQREKGRSPSSLQLREPNPLRLPLGQLQQGLPPAAALVLPQAGGARGQRGQGTARAGEGEDGAAVRVDHDEGVDEVEGGEQLQREQQQFGRGWGDGLREEGEEGQAREAWVEVRINV